MNKNLINYGIEPDFQLNVFTGPVNSVYMVSDTEYVASSTREIVKFEGSNVKMTGNFQFDCSCFVKPAEVIVGISSRGHEFVVLPINNFAKPIIEGMPTNMLTVFHILYSEKSSVLITLGTGIKTWKFEFPEQNSILSHRRNDIKITPISTFLSTYDAPIVNMPPFNYIDEELLLPSIQGLQYFKINGNQSQQATKLPVSKVSNYTLFEKTRKVLVTENGDVCVWNKFHNLTHRHTFSTELITSIFMPDKENAIIVTGSLNVFMMNVKTGRFWRCGTLPQTPNKIFQFPKRKEVVAMTFLNTLTFYKVNIPWKLWAASILKSKILQRVSKLNEAARILIISDSNFIKIYSPRTKTQVTTASPSVAGNIIFPFYDRGSKLVKKDNLFTILANGAVLGFETSTAPSVEFINVEMKATSMVKFQYHDRDVYGITVLTGDLVVVDPDNFNILQSIQVSSSQSPVRNSVLGASYIICFTDDETVLIDLYDLSIVLRKKLLINGCVKARNDTLYVGKESGNIILYEIRGAIINEIPPPFRQHNLAVTAIEFGTDYWISAALDGLLKFWDYKNENLKTINFFTPLFSLTIMNGMRDTLVGTSNDVMVVPGTVVFGNITDKENKDIDNFDRYVDELAPDSIKKIAEEERKRQELERLMREEELMLREPKKKNKMLQAFRDKLQERENAMNAAQDSKNQEEEEDSDKTDEFGHKKKKVYDEETRKKMLQEMMNFGSEPQQPETVKKEKVKKQKTENEQKVVPKLPTTEKTESNAPRPAANPPPRPNIMKLIEEYSPENKSEKSEVPSVKFSMKQSNSNENLRVKSDTPIKKKKRTSSFKNKNDIEMENQNQLEKSEVTKVQLEIQEKDLNEQQQEENEAKSDVTFSNDDEEENYSENTTEKQQETSENKELIEQKNEISEKVIEKLSEILSENSQKTKEKSQDLPEKISQNVSDKSEIPKIISEKIPENINNSTEKQQNSENLTNNQQNSDILTITKEILPN
ncbi:hypothetical protein TVAG_436440 [Trichomonas vaginalis G3]|uniref:Uncharacterized protein n=1 Tax=Trichomonas vaginalis (strain ATCC PRA-98 / G3) TaxID=412133 RepID=A2DF92_TRIV3|nr:quinoprotein alcohol dehydrogenase-like family [Trichomonas vaginalis G3]EAY20820.1 hypothetical protein TVAG_436440 [Trichomonas vaginalis G3]KAI5521572.1 quinoprotein alcohol dehydrogenase-like family [Trichomonas vaginalis G3]|eukprot:XP_001581806.1 hypothetical protein [Trichomonas vaginalis G3]